MAAMSALFSDCSTGLELKFLPTSNNATGGISDLLLPMPLGAMYLSVHIVRVCVCVHFAIVLHPILK